MMRLVMEAVMILAIIGGLVFISNISASENKARLAENTVGDDATCNKGDDST